MFGIRRFAASALIVAALVPATAATAMAQTTTPTRPPDSGTCPALDLTALRAPSVFRYGLSGATLQSDFFADGGLKDDGYRPERLTGYTDGDDVEYATRWVKADGPKWRARFGLSAAAFHAEYLAHKDAYRMTDVSGFNTPAGIRYNVIWEQNTAGLGWRIHRDRTLDQMDDLVDQYKSEGYAPLRVEGYRNDQGALRFISVWVEARKCAWQMEHRMTLDEYKEAFDDHAAAGYRQLHVDATLEGSIMRYHAIWWKRPGPAWQVRVDRDWYLYQQLLNNNWCAGFKLTNFYGADNAPADAARFGGIWTYNAPVGIDAGSSLSDRIREEVDCAPARGGAAVLNLTTGEEILHHGDQRMSPSSTTKSAILWTVLRKAEAEGTSLQTLFDLPVQLGSNQGPDLGGPDDGPLQIGNDETIEYLARMMIDYSNNWATNVLIDYVGMDAINDELAGLGLTVTRLNRYMTGAGAPSAHGLGGPTDDYEAGWDNVTTPREYATFLRLAHENAGLLGADAYAKFWEIMRLNNEDDDAVLDAGVGTDWGDSFAKAGSNAWGWDKSTTPWTADGAVGDYDHRPQLGAHVQRSEAGRLVFDNGQVVVYAAFLNDAVNVATYQPFDDALDCIVVEVVREYSGQTTGAALPQCQ
jgi:beta-lactamase class A